MNKDRRSLKHYSLKILERKILIYSIDKCHNVPFRWYTHQSQSPLLDVHVHGQFGAVHGHFFTEIVHGHFWGSRALFSENVHGQFRNSRALFWLFTGTFEVHGHFFAFIFTGTCKIFTDTFVKMFTATFLRFTVKKTLPQVTNKIHPSMTTTV